MINNDLKEQILSAATFSAEELEMISRCFVANRYDQKEHILSEGNKSSCIHFIVSGLVRVYHFKDAKEVTTYLACDGGFAASYSSFITQGLSSEYIQCLENTHTLSISYEKMQWLYQQLAQWQVVGRILAEQNYLCMADRILNLHSSPAKEKYLKFLQTSPAKIVQQTPLIYVASFLGIAPESLSRIRRETAKISLAEKMY
ncbi:cAMP-binding domain of CRP or a regulatory subunit of cAMP-dependent protein kinases [Pedobacter steynii]|uniref:cAMP-binding domain of CRP or a regulatory subunit of cAMP-dependent protein kinases n=1 Tax=Pedobacter steynii TaxID=430522 RepID=A0A1G9Y997_9SPHI|nr:cyclic nucleotide-binding domain-containing protein [Pedobacter steynii]SDN05694.1 cAMP-binding domain of CRP or a regulatory subunit of cAMP-dependent protein kinases [Pedobacter steynii]